MLASPSALDAHDLPQRVNDLDQVALRGHYRVDRLVGAGSFVEHAGVLAAFDGARREVVIGEREELACLTARHRAAGAVRAALEALAVALAAHDVRRGAHRAGDDPQL